MTQKDCQKIVKQKIELLVLRDANRERIMKAQCFGFSPNPEYTLKELKRNCEKREDLKPLYFFEPIIVGEMFTQVFAVTKEQYDLFMSKIEKEERIARIKSMHKIYDKTMIYLTPKGFILNPQEDYPHKSNKTWEEIKQIEKWN